MWFVLWVGYQPTILIRPVTFFMSLFQSNLRDSADSHDGFISGQTLQKIHCSTHYLSWVYSGLPIQVGRKRLKFKQRYRCAYIEE